MKNYEKILKLSNSNENLHLIETLLGRAEKDEILMLYIARTTMAIEIREAVDSFFPVEQDKSISAIYNYIIENSQHVDFINSITQELMELIKLKSNFKVSQLKNK